MGYEKRVNSISAKLAPLADLSLAVLGGDLKKAELLSARLGDVMSYLYGAMAAIRFYEQRIEDRKKNEIKKKKKKRGQETIKYLKQKGSRQSENSKNVQIEI